MSKRPGQELGCDVYHSSKKSKVAGSVDESTSFTQSCFSDDVWGGEFNFEEIELILSQDNAQETRPVVINNTHQTKPSASFIKPASFSYTNANHQLYVNNNHGTHAQNGIRSSNNVANNVKSSQNATCTSNRTIQTTSFGTQILAGSSKNIGSRLDSSLREVNYDLFRRNSLVSSTQSSSVSNVTSLQRNELKAAELKETNRTLLCQVHEKQGEVEYWKNRIKTVEQECQEKLKTKEIELSNQIKKLMKEKEEIKTQFELEKLEYNKLHERNKLLGANNIRLTQPSTSVAETSIRGKMNASFVRADDKNEVLNCSEKDNFRIAMCDKVALRVLINAFPLNNIPKGIFEPSVEEQPIVNVQIIEKSGQRNLPILQEDDSLRIFENPELVKPLVTTIGNNKLEASFFLPDLSELLRKNEADIDTFSMVPIINKLVATTRELILNSTIVLENIFKAMTNDDIRDMNDSYFSKVYNTPVFHTKTIFDGSLWHDEERGIEARRSLGVLSHVALYSTYLSEYIGGKTLLSTSEDASYQKYIIYMKSYNNWILRNNNYEFLQLILRFVTAVKLTRRAHQFTGFLSAIAITLTNAQKRNPFQQAGVHYVSQILKEIVLSRPLLQCFISLTQMIEVFGSCSEFTKELCKSTEKPTYQLIQNIIHYTSDACILEMLVKQLQNFVLDPITTIQVANALVSFIYLALCKRIVCKSGNYSVSELLHLVVKLVCDCSDIDCKTLKLVSRESRVDPYPFARWYKRIQNDWKGLNDEHWSDIQLAQFDTLKKGIRFFNFLMTYESPGTFQQLDSEVRLSSLLDKVWTIEGLVLSENEKEAISDLKKDLKQDSAVKIEDDGKNRERLKSIRSVYKKR